MKEQLLRLLAEAGQDFYILFSSERLKRDLFSFYKNTQIDTAYFHPNKEIVVPVIISIDDEIIPYNVIPLWNVKQEFDVKVRAAIGGKFVNGDIEGEKCGVVMTYKDGLELQEVSVRISHEA
jgi:hypothetical protein